jgi:hypothetical protein
MLWTIGSAFQFERTIYEQRITGTAKDKAVKQTAFCAKWNKTAIKQHVLKIQ